MDGYKLSRDWFDWCFENPEKISPNHSAIYFFAIEHCNRLGWKEKFWFPTQMAMDAIGIKKHETYIRYFNDIVEWGFFRLVQKSTNQYSSNIISLVSAIPKKGKALDKAFLKHRGKQTQPIGESNRSIYKQGTIEPLNNEPTEIGVSIETTPRSETREFFESLEENIDEVIISINPNPEHREVLRAELFKFYNYWCEKTPDWKRVRWQTEKTFEVKRRLATWFARMKQSFNSNQSSYVKKPRVVG